MTTQSAQILSEGPACLFFRCCVTEQTVSRMAELATWAEIWGITGLKDEDMESAFIKPFSSVQQAVDKALAKKGRKAKVLFLMNGSLTVPRIANEV